MISFPIDFDPFTLMQLLLGVGSIVLVFQIALLVSPRLSRSLPHARRALRWLAYAWFATLILLAGWILLATR